MMEDIEKIAIEIAEKILTLGDDYFSLVNCELKARGITDSRGIIFNEVGRIIITRKKASVTNA